MCRKNMQYGALLTREAYSALLDLKSLVELAVDKAHTASMEIVGLAINAPSTGDPLGALRTAADTLQSTTFETTVFDALNKIECAIAWYEELCGK